MERYLRSLARCYFGGDRLELQWFVAEQSGDIDLDEVQFILDERAHQVAISLPTSEARTWRAEGLALGFYFARSEVRIQSAEDAILTEPGFWFGDNGVEDAELPF